MQPTPTRSPAFTPDTWAPTAETRDRKSTRLNSSHLVISYAVFCLKKKKQDKKERTHKADGTHTVFSSLIYDETPLDFNHHICLTVDTTQYLRAYPTRVALLRGNDL